jgi:hypothetical protein
MQAMSELNLHRTADVRIVLHPVRTPLGLLLVATLLVAAYILTVRYPSFFGVDIARSFDLNQEANVPTWFSSGLWILATFLALAVSQLCRREERPDAVYWLGMIPLFLLLSLDEAGMLHEMLGAWLSTVLKGHPIYSLTYGSAVVGLGLLLLSGILYIKFLIRLESPFRFLFFLAAGLYTAGAIGMESVGAAVESGALEDFPLGQSWTSMIIYEEFLEMAGIIVLIHALLCIIASAQHDRSRLGR